ncbi:MAG: GNAT family N-acetyltransferase [Elusimicrobiota bacterium]
MGVFRLEDKGRIEGFLRGSAALHIYGLGDLDERFWPDTEWYGLRKGRALAAVAFLYRRATLLALCPEEGTEPMRELLQGIDLPDRIYAHLSPGLAGAAARRHRVIPHGTHLKMILEDASNLGGVDITAAESLSPGHVEELRVFYQESYPGNWFDPATLDTGQYFCVRQEKRLAAVAGVHVYSPRTRVAALGNIATHPAFRGRGLGRVVTAAVCRSLLKSVDLVGLNVKADNAPAVRLYASLGFRRVAAYEEVELESGT